MSLETKRIAKIIVFMKSFCFKIYINTSLHLPALHPSSRINSASGAYRVPRRLPLRSLCCTKARTEISSKSCGCILNHPSFSEMTVLFEKNDLNLVLGVRGPHQSIPCEKSLLNMGSKWFVDGIFNFFEFGD